MKNQQHSTRQPGTLLDASLFHKRVACGRLALGGKILLLTVCPGKAPHLSPVSLTARPPMARVAATLVVLLLPLLVACGTPHPTAAVSQTHTGRAPATALHPLTNPNNPYPVLAAADQSASLSSPGRWWRAIMGRFLCRKG